MRFLRSVVVMEVSIWRQIRTPEVDTSLPLLPLPSVLGVGEKARLVEGAFQFLQVVALRCFSACLGVLRWRSLLDRVSFSRGSFEDLISV